MAEGEEWDDFRLIEASSKLVSLSLVTRHDLDGSVGLSMHPIKASEGETKHYCHKLLLCV